MNIFLDLFLTFSSIGLFTFGGGYAMIPLIEDMYVDRKKWITHDELLTATVIAESTPGPIAINCATYVGYKKAGILGAIVSTLGVVIPSFIVIFIISVFLDNFLELTIIANAFKGIKIVVGFLILDAAISMIKKMKKKVFSRAIMLSSFFIMLLINVFSWNLSSMSLMLLAAFISLTIFTVKACFIQKRGMKQ